MEVFLQDTSSTPRTPHGVNKGDSDERFCSSSTRLFFNGYWHSRLYSTVLVCFSQMSTSSTRLIQVSNNNQLIQYEPDSNAWSNIPQSSNMFQIGNMGPPISSTLKTTENGMFSFSFSGVEIIVMVSYIPPSTSTESSPIANCKVDNNLLGTDIPTSAQNNWPICSSGNLPDGDHTLVVDVDLPNPADSSVFFDYILYTASSNSQPDLTGVSVRISSADPSISYSSGFVSEIDTGSAQLTNVPDAVIKVPFIGQQLTWYGAFSTSLPSTPSTAEYTIDGGSSTQFSISGPGNHTDGSGTTALNQVLFQTGILPQGSHELTATYLGNEQESPLGLAFVVVQNGSSSDNTLSNAPSPTVSSFTGGFADVPNIKLTTSKSFSNAQTVDAATTISTVFSTDLNVPITTFTTISKGILTTIVSTGNIKNTLSTVISTSINMGTPTTKSTSQAIPGSQNDPSVLIGVIAGVGTLVVLLLIATLFLKRRHRRSVLRKGTKLEELSEFIVSVNPSSSVKQIPLKTGPRRTNTIRTTQTVASSDSLYAPTLNHPQVVPVQELGMTPEKAPNPNQPWPLLNSEPRSLYALIPSSAVFEEQPQQESNPADGHIQRASQAVDINLSDIQNNNGVSSSSFPNHLHVDDGQQMIQQDAVDSEVGAVNADSEIRETSSVTTPIIAGETQMDSGVRLDTGETLSYRRSQLSLSSKGLPPTYTPR